MLDIHFWMEIPTIDLFKMKVDNLGHRIKSAAIPRTGFVTALELVTENFIEDCKMSIRNRLMLRFANSADFEMERERKKERKKEKERERERERKGEERERKKEKKKKKQSERKKEREKEKDTHTLTHLHTYTHTHTRTQ